MARDKIVRRQLIDCPHCGKEIHLEIGKHGCVYVTKVKP